MKRSIKRNERPKAWLGAVAAVASLIGSGISAYQGYKSAKAQQEEMDRQRSIEEANAMSQYLQDSQNKQDQLLAAANMKYKCGGRRKLSRLGSHSSTGGLNHLPDSNGNTTGLYFNDGTPFITTVDSNGDIINIPNAKSHDNPTRGRHGNLDIAKNGKRKAVLQLERNEPVRVKNNEVQVVSDSLEDPIHPGQTLADSVNNGELDFETAMNINDKYLNNMKCGGRRKLAKWGWNDRIGESYGTYGDLYTAGANVLGGLIQSGISYAAYNSLKGPRKPTFIPRRSLSVIDNINSRLANIEENRQRAADTYRRNIASGQAVAQYITDANQTALQQSNNLYESKYNTERDLINKNVVFQNEQDRYNAERWDRYNAENIEFQNDIREKKLGAITSGIKSIADGVNAFNTSVNNRVTNRINAFSARLASNPAAFKQAAIDDREGFILTFGKETYDKVINEQHSPQSVTLSIDNNFNLQENNNDYDYLITKGIIPPGWTQEQVNAYNDSRLYGRKGCRKSLKRI